MAHIWGCFIFFPCLLTQLLSLVFKLLHIRVTWNNWSKQKLTSVYHSRRSWFSMSGLGMVWDSAFYQHLRWFGLCSVTKFWETLHLKSLFWRTPHLFLIFLIGNKRRQPAFSAVLGARGEYWPLTTHWPFFNSRKRLFSCPFYCLILLL